MAVIGVQTCGLDRLYGVDGAYREMKAAGFGAADVNLNDHYSYRDIVTGQRSPVFSGPLEESLAVFKPYRDAAEKYGVLNAQAHAPFPSWVAGMDEQNDYLITVLERSVEICGFLGCPRLVVHPFFGGYDESLTPEAEWDLNMDRYARLIPAARKHGVTICLENMFIGHNRKLYQACCSDFTVACPAAGQGYPAGYPAIGPAHQMLPSARQQRHRGSASGPVHGRDGLGPVRPGPAGHRLPGAFEL